MWEVVAAIDAEAKHVQAAHERGEPMFPEEVQAAAVWRAAERGGAR